MSGVLSIEATGSGQLDQVLAIEAGPDTSRWLGITGRQWHERALADPDQDHLVGIYGGALVGFVVLAGLRSESKIIELRRIVVHAADRGLGHGRALFRAVTRRCYDQHGASSIWLDVKPDNNRARALYLSEGFADDGQIPDPTGAAGEFLIVMVHQHPSRQGGDHAARD